MAAISNPARDSSSTIASTVLAVPDQEPPEATPHATNNNEGKVVVSAMDRIKGFFLGPSFVCMLMMVAAGSTVSFQSGMNATMNRIAGRSFSSVMNFASGLAACLLFHAADLLLLRTPRPTIDRLKSAPCYAWLGGMLGTYYIIINILTVPRLGAGTVLSIFVCAQVIMACLMDHFGLTGIPRRKYSICRILASLGLIGCVAVITLF